AEDFYSYSGVDPLLSGFAYDGPVLIDVNGHVSLHLVIQNGKKVERHEIDYFVDEANPFAEGTAEKKFMNRIINENILPCAGDCVIDIPKSLRYSIGDGEKPELSGRLLSVSADNKLARYLPCTVNDGNRKWRFIVHLFSGEIGLLSKNTVPFEIRDWNRFIFTGKNLIWSIDNQLWSASKEEITIDRTKKHVIYWQDVAYKSGNPIQSFVLPEKPYLKTEIYDKAVQFNLYGDLRYRLAIQDAGVSGQTHYDKGLYTNLTFDTFEGDYIDSKAVFALYCDGVYQGEISSDYTIDRQPPLPPKIIASEPGEYVRRDVSLRIQSEPEAKIFVSIEGPFDVKPNSYIDNNSELNYVKPSAFSLHDNKEIKLNAGLEKPLGYKVFAYAEDKAGNTSTVTSYKVMIDEYNYYLDGSAPDFAADGSRLHPYNSFTQALKVINEGKFVHFFVSGTILLPKGGCEILSNCSFTGMQDARFLFQPSSFISVKDASLEMHNCVLQRDYGSTAGNSSFLTFERSAASFVDCELVASFESSGTALTSDASIISFVNSGLTAQASVYACGISSNNSRLQLSKCHFSSIADTAVNFSLKGGSFELKECDCKVISHLGRILEASGVNLRLLSNKFTGDFDQETKGINPIWKDEKSLVIEERKNKSEGFYKD
ncbi:MAG: hypothetical protein IJ727_04095, partial [Treponema sp.]|nr:hypothetical protein [Treponema sp.]